MSAPRPREKVLEVRICDTQRELRGAQWVTVRKNMRAMVRARHAEGRREGWCYFHRFNRGTSQFEVVAVQWYERINDWPDFFFPGLPAHTYVEAIVGSRPQYRDYLGLPCSFERRS